MFLSANRTKDNVIRPVMRSEFVLGLVRKVVLPKSQLRRFDRTQAVNLRYGSATAPFPSDGTSPSGQRNIDVKT
jgi:hypothetical protein